MKDKNLINKQGIITEALPNATFRVRLDNSKEEDLPVLAHVSGRIRMYRIKLLPGDKVLLEMSPYDITKGRIIKRL